MGSRGTRRRALSWYRGVEAAICYLLNDSFLTPAGAPLASPRTCEPGPGELLLDQTDGNFSIAGARFVFPAQGTPAWGDQDFYAQEAVGDYYERILGEVLKFRMNMGDDGQFWVGFNDDNTPTTAALAEYAFHINTLSAAITCRSLGDVAQTLRDFWPAVDEYAQMAICLSPYTSTGLHWYPAAGGTFDYGAHFFFRDEEADTSWRLAWYRELAHDDPLYPAFSNYDAPGLMDYVRIPCDTYEAELLTPTCWDEFTDNNGVTLPNHTITYGGQTWVNALGVWTILGNQATGDATGGAKAYVPTTKPDAWVESNVTFAVDSTFFGLLLRKSATTSGGHNLWLVVIASGLATPDTQIHERVDGVLTTRTNLDADWVQGTYNLRVRLDDEEITFYVDYVEWGHYASAWFNKHATWHGFRAQFGNQCTYDNFIVLPRGTGLTRICYDDFTHINGTSLDATTTEEGALAWVEDVGDWDIQANEANPDATADAHAHVVTTVSDVWVCARELNQVAYGGLLMRGSTVTDYWYYAIRDAAGTDSKLIEVDGGVQTVRSSSDTDAFTAGTRYYLDVSCEGQDINCYTNGTLRETFGAASFNETAVWHGLYANNAIRHDQFRVTEIPALGEYDAALDSF